MAGGKICGEWGMGLGRKCKKLWRCLWERERNWGFPAGPRRAQDATSRDWLFSWQSSPEDRHWGWALAWAVGQELWGSLLGKLKGACRQAWTFSKSFGDVWSWVGEGQERSASWTGSSAHCPVCCSCWALSPVTFHPPCRVSFRRRHHQDALHPWKSRSNTAGRAKYKIFPVLLAWARVSSFCLSNIFSYASGSEYPLIAWEGLGNYSTYFPRTWTTTERTWKNKNPSWDRICEPYICPNPGEKQDCGCLMWSNPSTKNSGHKICCWHILWEEQPRWVRTGEPKTGLWNFILDTWESKRLLKHADCRVLWVLAVLTTEPLPGWALFLFHQKMPIPYNGKTLQGCITTATLRQARLFSYPIPWLLTAHPGRVCRARTSILHINPSPHPDTLLSPCSMAKLLLACKGEAVV